MSDKVYKIQDTKSGGFILGGRGLRTSKLGKIWSAIGHVKNHISVVEEVQFDKTTMRYPKDAEVVEYELVEVRRMNVIEFYKGGGFPDDKGQS